MEEKFHVRLVDEATLEHLRDFCCSICKGFVFDPVYIRECAHIFCKKCISKWLENKQRCPLDQSVTQEDDLIPLEENLVCSRIINAVKVRCCHASCAWTGDYSSLVDHLDICLEQEVTCDYCNKENLIKRLMVNHKLQCEYRPVQCGYCDQRVLFLELPDHCERYCPKFPFECKAKPKIGGGCGELITRASSKTHRLVCKKLIISCQIQECKETFSRDSFSEHMQQQAEAHALLHMKQIVALQKELKVEREERIKLQEKVAKMESKQNEDQRFPDEKEEEAGNSSPASPLLKRQRKKNGSRKRSRPEEEEQDGEEINQEEDSSQSEVDQGNEES